MRIRELIVSSALIASVSGCAGVTYQDPPSTLTHQEFNEGVLRPGRQLIYALLFYYAERRRFPGDLETLAAFAREKNDPVDWGGFGDFTVSGDSTLTAVRANATVPSSLAESGAVTIAWLLTLRQETADANALTLAVGPESRFCTRAPGELKRTGFQRFMESLNLASSVENTRRCYGPSAKVSAKLRLGAGEIGVSLDPADLVRDLSER